MKALSNHALKIAPHTGACVETTDRVENLTQHHIAPHTGACVETIFTFFKSCRLNIAPHTGACVETSSRIALIWLMKTSHPIRVRVLKLMNPDYILPEVVSHPIRVRVLKRLIPLAHL